LSSRSRSQESTRRRLTAAARRALIEDVASELFAERGYEATSIDEIARRAGVTAPVVYDHFASKQDLHRHLLEGHFADLRALWREQLGSEDPPAERIATAVDAWFAYVEAHPYAWRMLFRDTTGDPRVRAIHDEVIAQSRAAVMPLFLKVRGGAQSRAEDPEQLDMDWEATRAVLQGLAQWWFRHQDVPRERVVASAMNALWIGLERVRAGESWKP
jgi:AcrR family transcriptional regulator